MSASNFDLVVRNARGEPRTISIVGVDEIDTDRGYISWMSPMARALTKAREGGAALVAGASPKRAFMASRAASTSVFWLMAAVTFAVETVVPSAVTSAVASRNGMRTWKRAVSPGS